MLLHGADGTPTSCREELHMARPQGAAAVAGRTRDGTSSGDARAPTLRCKAGCRPSHDCPERWSLVDSTREAQSPWLYKLASYGASLAPPPHGTSALPRYTYITADRYMHAHGRPARQSTAGPTCRAGSSQAGPHPGVQKGIRTCHFAAACVLMAVACRGGSTQAGPLLGTSKRHKTRQSRCSFARSPPCTSSCTEYPPL